jgi:hypothetical protein
VIASFWWFFGTKMSWTKKISALLVALIVLGAIILPYLYSIKKTTGQWKISQKENVVFSTALMAEGYESEYLDVSPLQYAKDNPIMFLKKTAKSLMKLLSRIPDACHPLIFVFLIIGLLSGVREKRFLLYAMSFLLFYFAGYAIFHPGRRYLVGWVPIIMFIPAYGMVFLSKSRVNMLRIIIVVSMLIILPKTFEIIREDGEGWKIAGEWIKNNYGSNKNILFEDGRVIYYADGKGISTADSDVVDFTVTSVKRPEGGQVFETKSGVVVYSER